MRSTQAKIAARLNTMRLLSFVIFAPVFADLPDLRDYREIAPVKRMQMVNRKIDEERIIGHQF